MSLQGNLADLPFEDLLELITRRDSQAVLRVNDPAGLGTKAVVYVANRELYSACLYRVTQNKTVVDMKCGEDVIHYLLGTSDAQFYFDVLANNEKLPERNISTTIREIMLANVFRSAGPNLMTKTPAQPTTLGYSNLNAPVTNYAGNITAPQNSHNGNDGLIASNAYTLNQPIQPPKKSQRSKGWISSLVTRIAGL